eukprot:7428506-Pyramimonas_sp.AAC.2
MITSIAAQCLGSRVYFLIDRTDTIGTLQRTRGTQGHGGHTKEAKHAPRTQGRNTKFQLWGVLGRKQYCSQYTRIYTSMQLHSVQFDITYELDFPLGN